jgi:GntR family galactonate operon transcriptional repressor
MNPVMIQRRTKASRLLEKSTRKRKPRVLREIVASLARCVLTGEIRPGEYLPKESLLCDQYGVSRTVIREATKVLESKGLLRSRSHVGTQVLEVNRWNMLDADLLAWAGPAFRDPGFTYSLMEARRIIEPAAAELAAERAGPRDLASMDDACQRMRASLPKDVNACSEADMDFHTALLIASHNHVLIQLASVIRASLRALFELTTHLGSAHEQALHLHESVVEAVRLRRPEVARAAILKILDAAVVDLALTPPSITPEMLRPAAGDLRGEDSSQKYGGHQGGTD